MVELACPECFALRAEVCAADYAFQSHDRWIGSGVMNFFVEMNAIAIAMILARSSALAGFADGLVRGLDAVWAAMLSPLGTGPVQS